MAEADAVPDDVLVDRDDVDHLYDLDPGEFVAARDALAKELREAGDRPAAAAVRELRRPTVTAWALNQVARRKPDDVAALLEAAEAVGAAQAAAVGSGTPEALRAATKRRRELVAALARAATALAGPAHADEIEATLLSAGADPEAGAALAAGRLARELATPAGFGLFGLAEQVPPTAVAPDDQEVRPGPSRAVPAPEQADAPAARKRATAGKPARPPGTSDAATTKGTATARPAPRRDARAGGPQERNATAQPAGAPVDATDAERRDADRRADEQAASARAAELERRRQEAAAAAEALAAAASAVGAAERELADATSALTSARAMLARASAAYGEASSALAELDG